MAFSILPLNIAAASNPTVAIYGEEVSGGRYRLVVEATASPADVGHITTSNVSISYDNRIISPVRAESWQPLQNAPETGNMEPFKSDLSLFAKGAIWKTTGGRTTFDITVMDETYAGKDASDGIIALEFYFVLAGGKTAHDLDNSTFLLAPNLISSKYSMQIGIKERGYSYFYGRNGATRIITLSGFTYPHGDVDSLDNGTYEQVITPPTIEEEGVMGVYCSGCGELLETKPIEKLVCAHNYVSETIKTATCVEPGEIKYTCTLCGYFYTEVMPTDPDNHTGGTYENIITPATVDAEGEMGVYCAGCHALLDTKIIEKQTCEHEFEILERIEATCVENGYIRYKCDVCGVIYDEILKALNHDYRVEERKDASCGEDGYVMYKCALCGDMNTEVLKAPEHAYVETVTEATLDKRGYTEYTCSVCGESYIDDNSYTYLVTIEDGGAGAGGGGSQSPGKTVAIKSGDKTGYDFSGWTTADEDLALANIYGAMTTFVMPERNVLIKANWTSSSAGHKTGDPGTGSSGGISVAPTRPAEAEKTPEASQTDTAIDDEKTTGETAAVPIDGGGGTAAKKWAIVSGIMLIFIGIMIGIAMFSVNMIKDHLETDETKRLKQQQQQQEGDAPKNDDCKITGMGATLAAPIEVTVNIIGEDGRYVKCGVQLEYDPKDVRLGMELEARNVQIKNTVIEIMSSKPLAELTTNEGKRAIREQIVVEVNEILPKTIDGRPNGKPLGRVCRSYFDSFMIQ
jgi:uncharacterized repeat protein (TIGR02543 family)